LSLLDRLISTGIEPMTASLLQDYLGCPDSEKIYNLIDKIGDNDAAATLTAAQDLISTGLSEVQLVDALVDNMRDLMVAKSAGKDSELLILTAEQRKRTSELAEKFDTAALVYNITTLEKLRWSIKNSDTPRALLEALLLRFALSEHFMNVDDLLAQSKGKAPTPIKKKQPPVSQSPKPRESSVEHQASSTENQASTPVRNSPIGTGNTKQKGKISNGTINQQQTTSNEPGKKPPIKEIKTSSRKKNNILNDPAVKTVIIGLDATITGIEED